MLILRGGLILRDVLLSSPGHKTYIGFLYLEHTQNNSVLNVFVSLLLDFSKDKKAPVTQTKSELEEFCSDVEKGSSVTSPSPAEISRPRVSRQAANRWLVAYTLLRNRTLQELTAARLEEKREVERKEEREGREDSVEKEAVVDEPVHETSMQSGMKIRDSFQEVVGGSAGATATTEDSSYHGNIKQTLI